MSAVPSFLGDHVVPVAYSSHYLAFDCGGGESHLVEVFACLRRCLVKFPSHVSEWCGNSLPLICNWSPPLFPPHEPVLAAGAAAVVEAIKTHPLLHRHLTRVYVVTHVLSSVKEGMADLFADLKDPANVVRIQAKPRSVRFGVSIFLFFSVQFGRQETEGGKTSEKE